MKYFWILLGVLAIGFGGFYLLNNYIYQEKQGDDTAVNMAPYFAERLTTLAVEDIGMPIEGFDAQLLGRAFPSLVSADFDGVETLEGRYVFEEGELSFERMQQQPVSSAERTISKDGYATLLDNVSSRLLFPVVTNAEVEALIQAIDAIPQVVVGVGIGGSVFALGVGITPMEVLEDSRCPTDVQCIHAGTVRVLAKLESGSGTSEQEFELETPVTTEAQKVTLVRVEPSPVSTTTIEESGYVLHFEIQSRDQAENN